MCDQRWQIQFTENFKNNYFLREYYARIINHTAIHNTNWNYITLSFLVLAVLYIANISIQYQSFLVDVDAEAFLTSMYWQKYLYHFLRGEKNKIKTYSQILLLALPEQLQFPMSSREESGSPIQVYLQATFLPTISYFIETVICGASKLSKRSWSSSQEKKLAIYTVNKLQWSASSLITYRLTFYYSLNLNSYRQVTFFYYLEWVLSEKLTLEVFVDSYLLSPILKYVHLKRPREIQNNKCLDEI